jgi:hypothetical protein
MPAPHFVLMKDRPGWSRAALDEEWDVLEGLAKTLNDTRPSQTYFICGALPDDTRHVLYRIETDDPLEIIKACEVGSHAEASYGENALPVVLGEMAKVHARNPIIPFFADAAGLKCTFEQQLTDEFADFLESTITEGCEAYADDGYIAPAVMRDKFLQLWWD